MMEKLAVIAMLCSIAVPPVLWAVAADGSRKEVEEISWFSEQQTIVNYNEPKKVTELHFYFQDLRGVTTATVAQSTPNITSKPPPLFGITYMADDPLTAWPSQASKVIGRAQGLYDVASMSRDISLVMLMNFIFTDGPYNGSTLSVMGANPELHPQRELPVVGGTGVFRLARGMANLATYFFDISTGNVTVEYNVTVYHN